MNNFGISPINTQIKKIGNWTVAKSMNYLRNVTHTLSINHVSNALYYRDETSNVYESKIPSSNTKSRFPISESNLKWITLRFLEKNKVVEPKNMDLKLEEIVYDHERIESIRLNKYYERVLKGTVIFTRNIDGIPVFGPGGCVMVSVGLDESVTSCKRIMRQVGSKIAEHKVINIDQALEQFTRKLNSYNFDRLISVLDMRFCYFEAGKNDKQEFFEPTYVIIYIMNTGIENSFYKSIEVIPAISNPKQMWPEKRFPNLQT
jgi:hypothetical protein